ncbi:hypothetical protein NMG60_11035415 [Bertholletia excelsa]
MFMCCQAYYHQLKQTKMTLHFQDYVGGPNATAVIVTGMPNRAWGFTSFGTIFVTDDPITKDPNKDSPEIARGQGVYVTSSLDGSNAQVMFSIVFTNEECKGSTLEIQGTSVQLAKIRELAVVGGTGKFRFARGYATFETVHLEALKPSVFYSVIRCNVTVEHY